MFIPTNKE